VAFEVAMGATFTGARTLVAMKHVGLNVAADPFVSISLIGAPGGLIVVSADDPGMHSSQNEQDNRYYAKFAGYPCIEPSDSQESKDFIGEAIQISGQYDVPVLFRMTTRICHSKSIVTLGERQEVKIKGFHKDPQKFVVLPIHARIRHVWATERLEKLKKFAETTKLNHIEKRNHKVGIICNGITYQYVKEVVPDASILKLGMSYPLPIKKIHRFHQSVKKLYIVEELEPFIEEQVKISGIQCYGKTYWSSLGELSPEKVEEGFIHAGVIPKKGVFSIPEKVLPRPPIFCPGCPHRGIYFVLHKLKATVSTDIGCYTLGALPPLESGDTCIEMGASIGVAIGMAKARGSGKGIVATIGDSTFLHSGMTGLLNAVNDDSHITIIILDNSITAMTGGQQHPGTGKTLKGQKTKRVQLAKICKAIGVDRIKVVDPYQIQEMQQVLKKEIEEDVLSVVITNRPCVLYPAENRKRVRENPFMVDSERCIGCHSCIRVGCPAISEAEEKTVKGLTKSKIDPVLCTGCSICAQICPVQTIIQIQK